MYQSEEQVFETINKLVDSDTLTIEAESGASAIPLFERLEAMLASGNENVLTPRQVVLGEFLDVARKSITKNIKSMDPDHIQFNVFRELSNFLEMAYTGELREPAKEYTQHLSAGHPLSTSPALENIEQEELSLLQSEWVSADTRIEETLRPVVASGFLAEPGSVEHRYIVARLFATDVEQVPRDVVFSMADRN